MMPIISVPGRCAASADEKCGGHTFTNGTDLSRLRCTCFQVVLMQSLYGPHSLIRSVHKRLAGRTMVTAGSSAQEAQPHVNRLAKEQSPYLLQHAHNPVRS